MPISCTSRSTDGIRAIVDIDGSRVRLWSRLGNEKTAQFPEIVEALQRWARRRRGRLVLDGEIVALDEQGNPAGFQQLQRRIHVVDGRPLASATALVAFDLLREGDDDLRERPLVERRAALERVFGRPTSPILRISEAVRGDGRRLYKRALESGWEGLIAKRADSRYQSGKRTPDWRKLKIIHEQEFVVGGWTEPRQTRGYFGALLLGVYPASREPRAAGQGPLIYVGHTGTGFTQAGLARVMALLEPLETSECPFAPEPKTNERPHWIRPTLVAQVKFTEWTADGKLRHPVYLGLRDDKDAHEVIREPRATTLSPGLVGTRTATDAPAPTASRFGRTRTGNPVMSGFGRTATGNPVVSGFSRTATGNPVVSGFSRTARDRVAATPALTASQAAALIDQLTELERARRDGAIDLPDGDRLSVSNLHKVFWPKRKLTKGDLFRYYAHAAPCILPVIADRPLTMKRYPNGIEKAPFYQHRAPDEVPPHVRVEHVPGEKTVPARFVGGALKTLLYMTQLASISQDPWFSRVGSPDTADHAVLDLDPSDGVPFTRVLDVARWIRDELAGLGAPGFPKTSGADGLHIYVPLPPATPYEAGLIFCQIIATVVAQKHPRAATVERRVRARGPKVYIDTLQNIRGKTLATAYSARASEYAGVSTPLTWAEVDAGVKREDFTVETVPARIREVGDLWTGVRTSNGVDLSVVKKYL